MAISDEEKELRDETRTALLQAIKAETELLLGRATSGSMVGGQELHLLAEAYEIAISTEKPPARMRTL